MKPDVYAKLNDLIAELAAGEHPALSAEGGLLHNLVQALQHYETAKAQAPVQSGYEGGAPT